MPESENLLRRIRTHFGWSQQALAECLGVLRVRVAEAETGVRSLPLAALPRMALLTTCLPVAPPLPPPPDPAALRQRQRRVIHLAAGVRRELERLVAEAAQAQARLAALPALYAAPAVSAPALGGAWLRAQTLEAGLMLEQAGPTVQALLRTRLAGLEAEAAALAGLLGEAPGA